MLLQIELLEESFDLIGERKVDLVDRTLTRLIELDPQFRLLFTTAETAALRAVLFSMLYVFRRSLRNLDTLTPVLETLGTLHQGYDVGPDYYGTLGIALLDAMAEIGGADWKPAYMAAWAEAYTVVWGMIVNDTGGLETDAQAGGVLVA